MTEPKNCEYCGGEFNAQRETAKYCSDSCKTLSCRQRRADEQLITEQEVQKNEILQLERKKLELIQLELEQKNELQKQWQDFENLKEVDRQQKIQAERDKKNEELKIQRQLERNNRREEADRYSKRVELVALGVIGIISKLSKR